MKKLFILGLVTTISTLTMATTKDRMNCTAVSERGSIRKLLVQIDDQKPFGKNMIATSTISFFGEETTVVDSGLGFDSVPSGSRMKIYEDTENRIYLFETTYGGNFQGVGAKYKQALLIENKSTSPGINLNSSIEFLDCIK